MAKTNSAPATTTAPAPAVVDLATVAANAINSRVDGSVVSAFDRAVDAAASGAFAETLSAAQSLNLSADELCQMTHKADNPISIALDALQFQTHAKPFSLQVLNENRRMLRLATLAGPQSARDTIKEIKNEKGEPKYKDFPAYTFSDKVGEEATSDAASEALDALLVAAVDRGDNQASVEIGRYIDAVGNPDKLLRLYKEGQANNMRRTRWRNGFLLHHVADLIRDAASDNMLDVAALWRDAAQAATNAHKKTIAAGNPDAAQLVKNMRKATADSLAEQVKGAVAKVTHKAPVPENERALGYIRAVWTNLRKFSELTGQDSFKASQVDKLREHLVAEYGDLFRDLDEEKRLKDIADATAPKATTSPLANAAAQPPAAKAGATVTQKSEADAASEAVATTAPARKGRAKAPFAPPAPAAELPSPTGE